MNSGHTEKPETIIWDWNGTLLDDVDVCLDSMNILLAGRGHQPLSKRRYREIFTFPVRSYYELAGFDFDHESFDEVAIEFIDLYRAKVRDCILFSGARPVLEWFGTHGHEQFMISAMEHQFLLESLSNCRVDHYFEDFTGIQDHFANGKAEMARAFIERKGIDPAKTLLIGDTLHDFEVAFNLGMQCLLVAGGHQSEERLRQAGCEVVPSLADVVDRFKQISG